MLKEISGVRQDDPKVIRRWFQDDYFDLFVWQSRGARITGFQLCYDIPGLQRVLSWHERSGFSHDRIDTGEATPERNMTPILVADGRPPIEEVLANFTRRSPAVDPDVREFISRKLQEYQAMPEPRE